MAISGHLAVRNRAQQILWERELCGQISDGQWENATPHDHWKVWCDAKVVVADAYATVGRNFFARRQSYNFTNRELLEVIGERMLGYVREEFSGYTKADMVKDLNDLKTIIKMQRPMTDDEHKEVRESHREDERRRQAAVDKKKAEVERLRGIVNDLGLNIYVSEFHDNISVANVLKIMDKWLETVAKSQDSNNDLSRG